MSTPLAVHSPTGHVQSPPTTDTTPGPAPAPTLIPNPNIPTQPHLVSLVLQSKKALQIGEHLCTRAHTASNASAQAAVDVLALDAKVRWVVEAVGEQLKLAASVAKTIEEKRAQVRKQVHEWDTARTKHTDALEEILESLGSQLVPPDFHQASTDSSLFGSQHGSDDEDAHQSPFFNATKSSSSHTHNGIGRGRSSITPVTSPLQSPTNKKQHRPSLSPVSPSATLRRNGPVRPPNDSKVNGQGKGSKSKKDDRRRWKTLRDFVDDQAIEDALETVESDRSALDITLSKTDDYPETLTQTIHSIHASLPQPNADHRSTLQQTQTIIVQQEALVTSMAALLENLASHYDGMASALRETELEKGEIFSEEDMQVMNRDTEELPAIMAELEESAHAIEGYHTQLQTTKENFEKDMEHLGRVLEDLDELGEIISEMLQTQETIQARVEEDLSDLHHHLTTLVHLNEQYISYRMAFNKLLLEIARRRQYKEAAENIVQGMMRHLESMSEEENRVRAHFNAEYGQHLPEDLCLCIGNSPTRWEVVPWDGTTPETLPDIDRDILTEAKESVGYGDGPLGAESL
ncbi:hypothetical protein M413DRAFT_446875 [Hebeloma cylindrosporum]|uniref:Autophagy-related protein 17 n=1 Tax=Hebeloma cylindrosporum TaxID=76867 RepID=A0A0C3C8P5_HEBCY|nr:hypothetical protein M413DRAFT_446875 [Hebeloma cylindrosporum h7]